MTCTSYYHDECHGPNAIINLHSLGANKGQAGSRQDWKAVPQKSLSGPIQQISKATWHPADPRASWSIFLWLRIPGLHYLQAQQLPECPELHRMSVNWASSPLDKHFQSWKQRLNGQGRQSTIYWSQPLSIRCFVDQSLVILEQLFPTDGLWKHLSFQPDLIWIVEILRQIQPLPQHTLQAVIHRWEFRVLGSVIPAAVKSLNVGPQGAFFCLEVPRPGVDVCDGKRERRRCIQFRTRRPLPQNMVCRIPTMELLRISFSVKSHVQSK